VQFRAASSNELVLIELMNRQLFKILDIGLTQIAAIAAPVIAVIFLWRTDYVQADNLTFDIDAIHEYSQLEMPFLYLIINGLTILFPFLLSFDKRVHFYKKWRYLFPATVLTALIFIPWDVLFTQWGVWGFNPNYYYTPLRFMFLFTNV